MGCISAALFYEFVHTLFSLPRIYVLYQALSMFFQMFFNGLYHVQVCQGLCVRK